jgi:hypothetical protein
MDVEWCLTCALHHQQADLGLSKLLRSHENNQTLHYSLEDTFNSELGNFDNHRVTPLQQLVQINTPRSVQTHHRPQHETASQQNTTNL